MPTFFVFLSLIVAIFRGCRCRFLSVFHCDDVLLNSHNANFNGLFSGNDIAVDL